jgi:hypothetical protein
MMSIPSAVIDVNHGNDVNHVKKADAATRRDKKPGTVPAPLGGGMLALFPTQTAGSIAKSTGLRGFAPS